MPSIGRVVIRILLGGLYALGNAGGIPYADGVRYKADGFPR